MGVVSLGRSLIYRQILLFGVLAALGAYGYSIIDDLGRFSVSGADAVALLDASRWARFEMVTATLACAVVVIAALVPITHHTVTKPLRALAKAVETLAAGNPDVGPLDEKRDDEIGAMARGLIALRDGTRAASGKAKLETDRSRDDHARGLATRIEAFSEDLGASVRRLAAMTQRMTEASKVMITAARHANDGSDQAKTASANAAGDVSSVATASEHLLVSIEQISQQVMQSTALVKNSVERTGETNAGMNRLATAAQKVGDVVSLISRIAAQTNLLALNATIEAARAGEAGRGFAVVAQEVKTLATQTAKATQDITGQIAEIQEATDTSVRAIEKIQGKISEVEHISTLIAAAVQEQGAATQAIARNVRSAASGTATISGHVENVVRSVGETSTSATSVADLARELDEIASAMTQKVVAFTQGLKAA